MSYGPVWYEWSKRERAPDSRATVTELFWCNPGIYSGAPGFTATKSRRLAATIESSHCMTIDEPQKAVRVTPIDQFFVDAAILKRVIDYAISDDLTPGTTCEALSEQAEYVPGKAYPCLWCGRDADIVCEGFYDPKCVDASGAQHSVRAAELDFDRYCHATCISTLTRHNGVAEKWTSNCYERPGHAGAHRHPGWNTEIWPTQTQSDWTVPTAEELSAALAKDVAWRVEAVARHTPKSSSNTLTKAPTPLESDSNEETT